MPEPVTQDPNEVPAYPAMLDLSNRTYVVLGAGQGMGRQSAHALHQAGASVACVDLDLGLATAIAKEVDGLPLAADITQPDAVRDLFDAATAQLGQLHGVVDIVGVATGGELVDLDDDTWDWQFNIVLRHAFHTIRYGAPHLATADASSMTFIGSLSGVMGIPGQAAYGAAKAALHHLVRTAALELAPNGIRINAVAPGFVMTPRLVDRMPDGAWEAIAAATPNRRVAIPSDIAATVLFLSSPLARHITAQVLSVDGGLSSLAGLPPMKALLGR